MSEMASRWSYLWSRRKGEDGNAPYMPSITSAGGQMQLDRALIAVVLALLAFGTVMVFSATVALPDSPRFARYSHTHFLWRHVMSVLLALVLSSVVYQFPTRV